MDIFIKNLEFFTIIGLLPHERKFPQRVIINATFTCKELSMQVDYAKAAVLIENSLKEGHFDTVENALMELEKRLKEKFPLVLKLKISLSKPDVLHNAHVGAQIERDYTH